MYLQLKCCWQSYCIGYPSTTICHLQTLWLVDAVIQWRVGVSWTSGKCSGLFCQNWLAHIYHMSRFIDKSNIWWIVQKLLLLASLYNLILLLIHTIAIEVEWHCIIYAHKIWRADRNLSSRQINHLYSNWW